jgi:HD-GYP domain-containing protein (c-di-GMP phosphodiesterase class II)
MFRISDILKKKAEAESRPQPQQPEPGPLPEEKARPEGIFSGAKEEPQRQERPEPGIRISETVMSKSKMLDKQESENLYSEAVNLVQKVYENTKVGKEVTEEEVGSINDYMEKFIDQQRLDNDNILSLLRLQLKDRFIYTHAVNVGIICIDLAIGLGYDRDKLLELGVIAVLHDIGMIKFYDLYNLPRKLNEKEIVEIKNHPKVSAEILEKFRTLYKKAGPVAYQEHERIDGSGYPNGLKEEFMDEYAKIIGPADTYEALTHSRPYRLSMSPCDALNVILENKNAFGKRIMKILIERLACPFPVGCNVKLSSGEKGKVIKRNLSCPLRPMVEIISTAEGENLEKSRIVDLCKHPTIFIKDILGYDKI